MLGDEKLRRYESEVIKLYVDISISIDIEKHYSSHLIWQNTKILISFNLNVFALDASHGATVRQAWIRLSFSGFKVDPGYLKTCDSMLGHLVEYGWLYID